MNNTAHIKLVILGAMLLVFALQGVAQDTTAVSDPDEPAEAGIFINPDSMRIDSFYARFFIDLNKCDNKELYYEVFRWYKTCYRWGGQSKKGVDCSGFVNMLYSKIYHKKIPYSVPAIYPLCRPLRKHEIPAEGDFVFFNIKGKKLSHIGIYLQHNKFAHASVHSGVVISDLDEPYYKKYFYKFGRLKE